MSQPAPPVAKPHPDRYVKHILIGCGLLVVLLVAIFAGSMAWLYKSTQKLMPYATVVLNDMRDGNVDKLYDEADPQYQTVTTKAEHDKIIERISEGTGALQSWSMRSVNTVSAPAGTTTVFVFAGKYEHGPGTITITLFSPNKTTPPKMMGFYVHHPKIKP